MKSLFANIWDALSDTETAKVLFAAALSWVSLEHVHIVFEVIASAGAAFYIWRKIYRSK